MKRTMTAITGWSLVAVYMAFIFMMSSRPGSTVHIDWFTGADKALHGVAYAGLGWLARGAWQPTMPARSGTWIWAASVVVASIYGVTDEVHQMFVPDRSADPLDWVADTVGAAIGAAARWFARR